MLHAQHKATEGDALSQNAQMEKTDTTPTNVFKSLLEKGNVFLLK